MAEKETTFDLEVAKQQVAQGEALSLSDLDITTTRKFGKRVTFCTDPERRGDPIQGRHRGGNFYEDPELRRIIRHFNFGGTFVDIGANVGNHTLFFALFGHVAKVIPFEPNPAAYRLLLANIAVNDLQHIVDVSHVGLGVSDTSAAGFGMEDRKRNLGAAKMVENEGNIEVVRGDDALRDHQPSFIKIDVEGMEMQVLRGLQDTLARCKPILFVEVDNKCEAEFQEWLAAGTGKIIRTFNRYENNTNYLLRMH